ncbi:GapS1 family protein [Pseudomonas sp. microsymbiont 2]
MSVEKYDKTIRGIKRELSYYRPDSILQCVLDHLHWAQTNKVLADGMPWLTFFMLKLGMLEGSGKGRSMSSQEFNVIVNKLYRIQHLACPVEYGGVELKLRSMFLQQEWYQRDLVEEVKSLLRQSLWFAGGKEIYSQKFHEAYGLSLSDFYDISLYFIAVVCTNKKGVVAFNLHNVIMHLHPVYSMDVIARYLLLVSVRDQDLPAFFKGFRLPYALNQQSEYFQTTPLRWRPIILSGENLFVCHPKLFVSGIGMLIPSLLKKLEVPGWHFKTDFGECMEKHVGTAMAEAGVRAHNESGIKEICRKYSIVTGKATDFLVPGEINLLVECKAIEPSDIVSSVFDAEVLKRDLKDSFIKAIVQCQETVWRLSQVRDYYGKDFACVVVTHEDFWFATAEDVAQHIDLDLRERLNNSYGCTPVPLSRILFLNINAWESMLASIEKVGTDLGRLVMDCAEGLSKPEGKRFTASQAVHEKLNKRIYSLGSFAARAKESQTRLQFMLEGNKAAWQGRTVSLVRARAHLLRYLHMAFDKAAAE